MNYRSKEPTLFSKLLRSRWSQVVLLLLVIAMSWQVYERYTVERQAAERRAGAEQEFQSLLEQRAQLARQVDTIQDDFGIESEIRRNFDVARAGEQIVIILDDDINRVPLRPGPDTSSLPEPDPARSWFPFW